MPQPPAPPAPPPAQAPAPVAAPPDASGPNGSGAAISGWGDLPLAGGGIAPPLASGEPGASAPPQPSVSAAPPISGPFAPSPPPVVRAGSDPDSSSIDPFAHAPPFRPRRNPTRRWTIAAFGAGTMLIAGAAAIVYFGTPSIAGQLGLPVGQVDIPLLLEVPQRPERRTLESGNELFAVSGRIVNPTQTTQRVPDILAELRDERGRVVYGWTITPPRRTLGPRATADFNSAEVDVPKGARELNLSFSGAGPP